MVDWPHCFWVWTRQHIMAEVHGGAKLLTSWPGNKREQGPHIPFKDTPPMTQRPPTTPHLLKAPPLLNVATQK
jgi:hypothetical protein